MASAASYECIIVHPFIPHVLLIPLKCIFVDLTHTADIQFHSWGTSLIESFEQSAYALYDYMTNRSMLPEQSTLSETIATQGDNPTELLYNFLDELLFKFHTKPFLVAKKVDLGKLEKDSHGHYKLVGRLYGEAFDPKKYPVGTEVNAITSSNIRVSEVAPYDIYVIVDI